MSPQPVRVSGIVLAGGRSRRFGGDKLAAEVGGRPLLHHALAAVASICDEVVLVIGEGPAPALNGGLAIPVRVIRDEVPEAGPLAGLVTGLAEAVGDRALVVGGDMPGLVPDVLRLLVERVGAGAGEAAALREGSDTRPLPLAVARAAALLRGREVRAAGASSLRALLGALDLDAIEEAEWRRLDPSGATLLDVDTPEDVAQDARRATMFNRT